MKEIVYFFAIVAVLGKHVQSNSKWAIGGFSNMKIFQGICLAGIIGIASPTANAAFTLQGAINVFGTTMACEQIYRERGDDEQANELLGFEEEMKYVNKKYQIVEKYGNEVREAGEKVMELRTPDILCGCLYLYWLGIRTALE